MPRRYQDSKEGASRRRRRPRKDEEEEEEEEEEHPSKRIVSRWFEIEAEEADSGDEDDECDEDADDGFFVKGNDIPEDEYEGVSERVHQQPMVGRRDEDEVDVEAIEKMVNERYGSRASVDYDENFDEEITQVEKRAYLPSVRDPKLWMVKCLPGHEREVAASLMQKSLDKGSELHIISAIALDNLKSYIYVEAFKEGYVREACKGIRSIFSRNITMVPMKEMSNVLSVEIKGVNISRGDWVRLKRSSHKGDLAKVVDVDNVRHKVTVKVSPRVGSLSMLDRLEGLDSLYKTVALSSVATEDIQPSIQEIENFREIGENDRDLATLFKGKDKGCWMRGDAVIVVKGELKNLKGSVEYVEGDIVHIKPFEKIPLKTVAVPKRDLSKYFEIGCNVEVMSGVQAGATGMVVKVDRDKLVILSNASKEHMTVLAGQVVESKGTSESSDKFGVGYSNRDTHHKASTSRHFPPRASWSNSLPGRGPPIPSDRVYSAKRHDSFIGSNVKILCGPYRGYRGRVKGVSGQNVRIELEAQMKVITVDRSQISDNVAVPSINRNTPQHRTGGETPLHPQTPMHSMGGETPWRTPLRTPSHPSTPVHHGSGTSTWEQWNPLRSPSRLVPTP